MYRFCFTARMSLVSSLNLSLSAINRATSLCSSSTYDTKTPLLSSNSLILKDIASPAFLSTEILSTLAYSFLNYSYRYIIEWSEISCLIFSLKPLFLRDSFLASVSLSSSENSFLIYSLTMAILLNCDIWCTYYSVWSSTPERILKDRPSCPFRMPIIFFYCRNLTLSCVSSLQ